jgi:hypothetical protein
MEVQYVESPVELDRGGFHMKAKVFAASVAVVLFAAAATWLMKGDGHEATEEQSSTVSDMASRDAVAKAMLDRAMKDGSLSQAEATEIIKKNQMRLLHEYRKRLEEEIEARTNAR